MFFFFLTLFSLTFDWKWWRIDKQTSKYVHLCTFSIGYRQFETFDLPELINVIMLHQVFDCAAATLLNFSIICITAEFETITRSESMKKHWNRFEYKLFPLTQARWLIEMPFPHASMHRSEASRRSIVGRMLSVNSMWSVTYFSVIIETS